MYDSLYFAQTDTVFFGFAVSGIAAKNAVQPFIEKSYEGKVKAMILSYLRTLFLYLVLIFAVRLMGKRQIGEMEPAEFVVTMLVANLAAIPMQDRALHH